MREFTFSPPVFPAFSPAHALATAVMFETLETSCNGGQAVDGEGERDEENEEKEGCEGRTEAFEEERPGRLVLRVLLFRPGKFTQRPCFPGTQSVQDFLFLLHEQFLHVPELLHAQHFGGFKVLGGIVALPTASNDKQFPARRLAREPKYETKIRSKSAYSQSLMEPERRSAQIQTTSDLPKSQVDVSKIQLSPSTSQNRSQSPTLSPT